MIGRTIAGIMGMYVNDRRGLFVTPDIADALAKETRKHLPEGYVANAGRVENMHAFSVSVWRLDPEKHVQGLEDVVIRVILDYAALLQAFRGNDWRLGLINELQRDFDTRKMVREDDSLELIKLNGRSVAWRKKR